jgi:hypothetical protein
MFPVSVFNLHSIFNFISIFFFQMAANAALTYDQVYTMVKNGYTGDPTIWDQTYTYSLLHPKELFQITANRRWSIGHQLIYHGCLKVFKRLLSLYSESNPINIFEPGKDNKTILDIANERKAYYKEQYTYIEHLFAQDKFIQACRAYNWPAIDDSLHKYPTLLNEKPPYYSNYFIHYLVLYGDVRKFAQYNGLDNKFQLDLQNTDGKTALDLARDRKNDDFIAEIQQLLPPRDRDRDSDMPQDDRRSPIPSPTTTTTPQTVSTPTTLSPQILQNLTCILTKQIFVEPVTASDGQTYERKAIISWLGNNRYSPKTGEPLNDTFIDNTGVKELIADLRRQKLIP